MVTYSENRTFFITFAFPRQSLKMFRLSNYEILPIIGDAEVVSGARRRSESSKYWNCLRDKAHSDVVMKCFPL